VTAADSTTKFLPVAAPYEATVLVGYLDKAFNGDAIETPPRRSPLWPIACKVIEAMTRDRYHLGAYPSPSAFPQVLPTAGRIVRGPSRGLAQMVPLVPRPVIRR
jgi:hypothetical protein